MVSQRAWKKIDAALFRLALVKSAHRVPGATINQFKLGSLQIRGLADGLIDGYGYDYGTVGKRMGHGFANMPAWVKASHR